MIKRSLRCTALLVFLFGQMALSQDKPTVSVTGLIDDSVVTIRYTIPTKMFVELSVFNRQGYIIDIPLSKELEPCKDSIKLHVADYFTGTYFIQCTANHSSGPLILKQFRHVRGGKRVTFTPEEIALHNKLPACDKAVCPPGSLSAFDEFLRTYPNYIDKGEVFQRALVAYVKLDQDSILISATIDSLTTYLPTFWSYYTIARYLIENHRLPSLASTFLIKASENLSNVPLALRDKYGTDLADLRKSQQ